MNSSALPILALSFLVASQQESRDLSKRAVELPLEHALSASPSPGTGARTVAPGLVRWHADFASACAAAERSGKPVLLFQLLGRLDQEFC
jgi:hypothetical protein